MKTGIAIVLLVALLGLTLLKVDQPEVRENGVKSSRQGPGGDMWTQGAREMSLAEMSHYASGLSEKKLWDEFDDERNDLSEKSVTQSN